MNIMRTRKRKRAVEVRALFILNWVFKSKRKSIAMIYGSTVSFEARERLKKMLKEMRLASPSFSQCLARKNRDRIKNRVAGLSLKIL